MRSAFFSALALATLASAEIFITEPVASTTCTAGVACYVRWNDDANTPALASIGPCQIDLMTGGQQQQTLLQNIAPSLDVSTNSFVSYLPDATVGPNGADYFIRFQSLSLKSTDNPAYPYQSFSAKFTLNGMTGTFNSTIQGQIDGTSGTTAAATSAAAATSNAASSSASKAATSAANASASAKASASATASANGVLKGLAAPGAAATALLGVVLGLVGFAI